MEQEKKQRARRIWPAVLITALATLLAAALALFLLLGRDGLALMQGFVIIRTQYVGECDLGEVADAGLDAMVTAMGDRWSYHMDAEAYEAQQARRSNSYVGIGVTVTYTEGEGMNILSVAADSPAEEAGLLAGERIVAVDGASILTQEGYDANPVTGESGTAVTLDVVDAAGETRQVTLTRASIASVSVTGELLEGDIALVTIANFYSSTADQFRQTVEDLQTQGARGFIFDLRNNPGGYVSELTEMLDFLLPEGPIFTSEPRYGAKRVEESDAACVDAPFVVLVNADSYSAAEFFAAQLRESAQAWIVGEVTSGKGYSQNTFPLLNGGAMNISTARYSTGNGVSLVGTGLTPDDTLSLTEEEDLLLDAGALDHGEDEQLQRVLEHMEQELS